MESHLAMVFLTNTWAVALLAKKMLLKPGATEGSQSGRTEYVSVKDATRLGRRITRTITILSIDFSLSLSPHGSTK